MKYHIVRNHMYTNVATDDFEVMVRALLELARDPQVKVIEIRGRANDLSEFEQRMAKFA